MASQEAAIKNNLNDRARKVGQFDELTTQDIDALIAFYDYSCLKCGKKPSKSVDHVIALMNGGTNTLDNLQLLCKECNKGKGDTDTDYRKGEVCPPDFQAPQTSEKQTRRRHDWDALRHEYITGTLSLRQLADAHDMIYTLVFKRSVSEGWDKQRKEFGSNLVATVNEQVKELAVEREVSMRSLLFDVIEAAVSEWSTKPRSSTRDLAELLKLGLVAQGGITERTAHVEAEYDDAALLARINQAFDTGQAETTYSPLGPEGEETSTDWANQV